MRHRSLLGGHRGSTVAATAIHGASRLPVKRAPNLQQSTTRCVSNSLGGNAMLIGLLIAVVIILILYYLM
jgi:hypothetical protein